MGGPSRRASQQIASQLKELAAAELEAAVDDIVLANGNASVAGTPAASVAIADLAAIAAGGDLLLGTASAPMPEWPALKGSTCVGDQGVASWLAPQLSCHVVRVRLDRDTGVARVVAVHAAHDSGTIINPIGAHGQVEGGILMGIGQALTEGTQYGDDAKQKNAALLEYKLQTIADAPSIHTQFVEIPTPDAGPRGAKGLAEAPNVATAGAVSNALAQLVGQPVRQLPMTAERVWETLQSGAEEGGRVMSFAIASTLDEALAQIDAGARPIAGGTDLVVGARQGKAPLPESLVAIDRIDALAQISVGETETRIGSGVTHARLMSDPAIVGRFTAIADASALVGSPSTRNVGTLGGNVMNASPAMDTGAPLLVLGAEAELTQQRRKPSPGARRSVDRARPTRRRAERTVYCPDRPNTEGTGAGVELRAPRVPAGHGDRRCRRGQRPSPSMEARSPASASRSRRSRQPSSRSTVSQRCTASRSTKRSSRRSLTPQHSRRHRSATFEHQTGTAVTLLGSWPVGPSTPLRAEHLEKTLRCLSIGPSGIGAAS